MHLACLPSRHETFPFTQSFSLLSPWSTALADTTDTLSPASPQIIGSIEPADPKLPADSLSPILPRDSLIFEPLGSKGFVGTPAGAVSVSETGAANYTIDIEAPDGGALTPRLSLVYDSQQGDYGLAGYGFGLTGLSAITRGAATCSTTARSGA